MPVIFSNGADSVDIMRKPFIKYNYFNKVSGIAMLLAVVMANAGAQINAENQPLTFSSKASLNIPALSGAVTIDGRLTDKIWDSAIVLPLSGGFVFPRLEGGETRIALCGSYLCLSAWAPEKDRLTAHASGINAVMWQEDLMVWRIRFKSPLNAKNTALSIAVNPAGAFSILSGDYYFGRNDIINSKDPAVSWSEKAMVSSFIDSSGWKVEAAIPLEQLGSLGFLSIERIRPLRPEAPEYRWSWPSAYTFVDYAFTKGNEQPEPEWKRSVYSNDVLVQPAKNYSFKGGITDKDISSLPSQAWTIEEQRLQGVTSALEKSIRSRIRSYAEKEKTAWLKVKTLADWAFFRSARIDELKKWLGPFPERTPLQSAVTASRNYDDGFIIENIAFESRPGLLVAANLYRPEKITGKIPAIIIVHSLHYPKTQLELQEMGMTLARSGSAVLVMDQLCAGERTQSQPWHREGYFARYALGNQLYLAGESLVKWMAWDISRSVDLLLQKQYIDTAKIVLIGAVAGGGDPAAIAAILDQRIAGVIPFNFGEAGPEEHYLEGPRYYDPATADPGWAYWETTRNLPFSVSKQFFPWFLCAASAPRYFAYSIEMGWPISVE
ncbi:MAG: acetylxylan esterase, partial [Flavitalea sp.]